MPLFSGRGFLRSAARALFCHRSGRPTILNIIPIIIVDCSAEKPKSLKYLYEDNRSAFAEPYSFGRKSAPQILNMYWTSFSESFFKGSTLGGQFFFQRTITPPSLSFEGLKLVLFLPMKQFVQWGISLASVTPICCGSGGRDLECP